jgi:hypothetical protein
MPIYWTPNQEPHTMNLSKLVAWSIVAGIAVAVTIAFGF